METVINVGVGLFLNMYNGRLMLVDLENQTLLLEEENIDINARLKFVLEVLSDDQRAKVSIHPYQMSYVEATNLIQSLGRCKELCPEEKDVTFLLEEAMNNYPNEIESINTQFSARTTHIKIRLDKDEWLSNLPSLFKQTPEKRDSFVYNLQGAVGVFTFDDPMIYFWGMEFKVTRPKGPVNITETVMNIALIDAQHADMAHVDRFKYAWGFTFLIKTNHILCKPFRGKEEFFKSNFKYRELYKIIIILDKVYGRMYLIDPINKQKKARLNGMNVHNILKLVAEYPNQSTESSVVIALRFILQPERVYDKADVIRIIEK